MMIGAVIPLTMIGTLKTPENSSSKKDVKDSTTYEVNTEPKSGYRVVRFTLPLSGAKILA